MSKHMLKQSPTFSLETELRALLAAIAEEDVPQRLTVLADRLRQALEERTANSSADGARPAAQNRDLPSSTA
jgi:tRNA 2-selenouridine synthase SelU